MAAFVERRRQPRYPIHGKLRLLDLNQRPVGVVVDISPGGLCLESPQAMAPGVEIALWLELPTGSDAEAVEQHRLVFQCLWTKPEDGGQARQGGRVDALDHALFGAILRAMAQLEPPPPTEPSTPTSPAFDRGPLAAALERLMSAWEPLSPRDREAVAARFADRFGDLFDALIRELDVAHPPAAADSASQLLAGLAAADGRLAPRAGGPKLDSARYEALLDALEEGEDLARNLGPMDAVSDAEAVGAPERIEVVRQRGRVVAVVIDGLTREELVSYASVEAAEAANPKTPHVIKRYGSQRQLIRLPDGTLYSTSGERLIG